mgnify:CR=1 FL=1
MHFTKKTIAEKRSNLISKLQSKKLLRFPGAYNPLCAKLIAEIGFDGVYVSGGVMSNDLGLPDIGLTSLDQVSYRSSQIARVTDLPTIVDIDTGFGNCKNTIEVFEAKGLAGCHLEDQVPEKRCGHLDNKELISIEEMVKKIEECVKSRKDKNFLIIARTDARAVEGLQEAIDRAHTYEEAGADILFIEAPRSVDELKLIRKSFDLNTPLLANMVEGGKTPVKTANDLKSLGFNIVIFPGGAVRAATFQLQEYYAGLLENGSNAEFSKRMHDFDSLNAVIGTPELLSIGKKYE